MDVLAGQQLTAGILAALYARERTGRGQRVEVDLLGSLLAGLVNQASAYLNAGVVPAAGWATGTRASRPTRRCGPATASSRWRWATTASSSA